MNRIERQTQKTQEWIGRMQNNKNQKPLEAFISNMLVMPALLFYLALYCCTMLMIEFIKSYLSARKQGFKIGVKDQIRHDLSGKILHNRHLNIYEENVTSDASMDDLRNEYKQELNFFKQSQLKNQWVQSLENAEDIEKKEEEKFSLDDLEALKNKMLSLK